MPNILIRDVPAKTVAQLKARAKRHNRSLQGEVMQLIEESVKPTLDTARSRAMKIRASFGKKVFSDSVELIREDRDR